MDLNWLCLIVLDRVEEEEILKRKKKERKVVWIFVDEVCEVGFFLFFGVLWDSGSSNKEFDKSNIFFGGCFEGMFLFIIVV